jgi:hypothetical protein
MITSKVSPFPASGGHPIKTIAVTMIKTPNNFFFIKFLQIIFLRIVTVPPWMVAQITSDYIIGFYFV